MIMISKQIPMNVFISYAVGVDEDAVNEVIDDYLQDAITAIQDQVDAGRPPWATLVEGEILVMIAEGQYGANAMQHLLGREINMDADYYALGMNSTSKNGKAILAELSRNSPTIKKVIK